MPQEKSKWLVMFRVAIERVVLLLVCKRDGLLAYNPAVD
jgi:hypothetical protein